MSDMQPKPSVFRRPDKAPEERASQALNRHVRPPGRTIPNSTPSDSRLFWLVAGIGGALVAILALGRHLFGLFLGAAIILWLVSPLIGALIWQRKGGHAVAGFVGGLVLGPFVLLMLLADPGKKKCPACASWIPKGARVCAQCREQLSAV